VNAILERNLAPLPKLESDFAAFARERALNLAPGLTWDKPPEEGKLGGEEAYRKWIAANPTNFWVLSETASTLMDAKRPLLAIRTNYPGQIGAGSAGRRLAAVHRALGETNAERALLAEVTLRDAAAPEECLRLIQLATAATDWPQVVSAAERLLAVNPLTPVPYRALAAAGEATGSPTNTIGACLTLLQMDPQDPAEVHFRLARAMDLAGDPRAKREVLESLEDSPRNREALRLLRKLAGAGAGTEAVK
jgi:hypothetical protein